MGHDPNFNRTVSVSTVAALASRGRKIANRNEAKPARFVSNTTPLGGLD